MPVMNDRQRAVMDEVTMLMEKEKRYMREVKENMADTFSCKEIMELLEPRRSRFDHALVNCLAKWGVNPNNIREQLDREWYDHPVTQGNSRYRRILDCFPGYYDHTFELKTKKWHDYIERAQTVVEQNITKP
jgi:hypothetical protein